MKIVYIVGMPGRIKNLLVFNARARKNPFRLTEGSANYARLRELVGDSQHRPKTGVNKDYTVEQRMMNALRKASKSAFAQDYFDTIAGSGAGPETSAMLARDMSSGNLGSGEIPASELGYVFSANADACPRCLMFDGTWVANPIDAQLLSHPGCRCSVVPRRDYVSYKKETGISIDEALSNNKDYGHSTTIAPWAMLKDDRSYWGLGDRKGSRASLDSPWETDYEGLYED